MDLQNHIPSLTHLREFTRARANGRPTHVAQDRRQVAAPADNRIFAFVYEKFLSRVVEYVDAGNNGGALGRAVAEASDRMRPSYESAAKGMTSILATLSPTAVVRRQRNIVVLDRDGYELVSLRIHLLFETRGGRLGAFMYFSDKRLTAPELAVMETAVALAVRQLDATAIPTIVMARSGVTRIIDSTTALSAARIRFLRSESIAYREAWDVAA